MGAIAARLADHVTVTSDNSRSEDTTDIIAEITAGISGPVITIEDRASAIRAAISEAGSHDIVVIAGKGHETAQEIDGCTIAFNDALFAQAVLDETVGDR
jgi:UDP-N-acetylmuramoyl-L-alanyl-D-glutamate--2,6-diaminopimelate ligase